MPETTSELRNLNFTALKKLASKYKEFMPKGYSKLKANDKEDLIKMIVKASKNNRGKNLL